ncbi:hypothetical protein Q2X70_004129 [Salmonella enterica]|nr:hypothetical protein [Salmonella enterica]ELM6819960.1 hypothetical protein [Salmonella enterica]ELV6918000.1 hypothetical protein [Salmonella enterica]
MKNKNISIRLGLALMASLFSVSVGASVTSDTVFTATIGQPSCSITAPASVDLGELNPVSVRPFPSFNITVNCAGTISTRLWAKAKNGVLTPSSRGVYLEVDGKVPSPEKATEFYISSGYITQLDLSGRGETDPALTFCSGDTNRVCLLKPALNASKNAELGNGTVTITFNLQHQ